MNTETKAIFLKNLSELNISNLPKVLELDWNFQEILMITEHVSGITNPHIKKSEIPPSTVKKQPLNNNTNLAFNVNQQIKASSLKYNPNGLQDIKFLKMCYTRALSLVLDHFKQNNILKDLNFVEQILGLIDPELVKKDFRSVSVDLILKRIFLEYRNLSSRIQSVGNSRERLFPESVNLTTSAKAAGYTTTSPMTPESQVESLKRIGQRLAQLFCSHDIFSDPVRQIGKIELEPKLRNNVLTKKGREMIRRGLYKSNSDSVGIVSSESFLEEWWGWDYLNKHFGFIILLSLAVVFILIQ